MCGLAFPPAELYAQTADALEASASLRTRVESWNWFDAAAGADSYTYVGSLLRAGVAQRLDHWTWSVELAAPILLALPDDATAPPPQGQLGLGAAYFGANGGDESAASVFLKQAYLRYGAAPNGIGHGIRAGRFEFIEGLEIVPADPTLATLKRTRIAHRLLGNFAWSHVGRSFDGAEYAYRTPGLNVTAAVLRPTQGVFEVDGWPGLDLGVGYAAVTLRDREDSPGEGRLFAMYYQDYRHDASIVPTDNRPLPAR